MGSAAAFTPPLNAENSSQTGSREFDNMLDRICHSRVVCVSSNVFTFQSLCPQHRDGNKENNKTGGSSSFSHRVFSGCVCILVAREDVDIRIALIRIEDKGIALWVEIALPLLR